MGDFIETKQLSHDAAIRMAQKAAAKATEIGQPQCIAIVDASGDTIITLRMTGAKFLSQKSALTKARTAASNNAPSAAIPADFQPKIAAATQNNVTGLPGGLPIRHDGKLIGGIGIGSGSGDQDLACANAALAEIGAETFE